MWNEITHPFANFNIEVWELLSNFIALYWEYDYLSMIKKSFVVIKWAPGESYFKLDSYTPTFTSNPTIGADFEGTTISYYAVIRYIVGSTWLLNKQWS